jgi:hypothetical protein
MNSKKTLISIIVIVIVVAAGWYFLKGGFSSFGIGRTSLPIGGIASQPGIGGEITDQTTGGIGSIGKMTDDIYVDLMVKMVAIQGEKNPATYATEVQNLYKEYGVTKESLEAYASGLEKDPQRAAAIAQKYMEELKKLQGASH